jgi:hypothetical protein
MSWTLKVFVGCEQLVWEVVAMDRADAVCLEVVIALRNQIRLQHRVRER